MKADARKKEIIEELTSQINKFIEKYNDYNFNLYFPDEAHLVVSLESSTDYAENIHDDLCESFDVNLQYVTWVQQQNPNKYTKNIELIYTPRHHYTTNLKWNDIKLKTSIQFD